MDIYILDKDEVIKQILQNIVEASIISPSECKDYESYLQKLDPVKLIATLIESWCAREQALKPINFYPIDIKAISMN